MNPHCPDCGSDAILHDAPYAECTDCGWYGQESALVKPD
jgi:hypothetical protein